MLRIVAKDVDQLALIKDLEDMVEFEVIHHPPTKMSNTLYGPALDN